MNFENCQNRFVLTNVIRMLSSAALLLCLTYSMAANSAILQLDFTTYTQSRSVCVSSNCTYFDFYSDPIVSGYQFILDTSSLVNNANTTAYNYVTTFTESVNTSVMNSSGSYPSDFYSTNVQVDQTYTQVDVDGTITSEMGMSTRLDDNYNISYLIDQVYTGYLPPELVPEAGTTTVFENGGTQFSWNNIVGAEPDFVVFDEATLATFYASLIGEQFFFFDYENSYTCDEVDIYGNCLYPPMDGINISNNGYAVLSATTVVPVPAAFWLFLSGLIGLIGIARRKAS